MLTEKLDTINVERVQLTLACSRFHKYIYIFSAQRMRF